jgi:hypothetical protein
MVCTRIVLPMVLMAALACAFGFRPTSRLALSRGRRKEVCQRVWGTEARYSRAIAVFAEGEGAEEAPKPKPKAPERKPEVSDAMRQKLLRWVGRPSVP